MSDPQAERLVETVRTTPTPKEFAAAALKTWPEASKASLAVLWAQFCVETARGQHCYGWNIGNVKYVPGCGCNYHSLSGVWEVVDGKKVFLSKDHPGSRFRSFATLNAGMRDHIEFIRRPGYRYATAWPHVVAGDYPAYVAELKRKGYFTGDLAAYIAIGMPRYQAWMAQGHYEAARAELAPPPPEKERKVLVSPNFARSAAGMHLDSFIEVELNGVKWLVAPIYIAPIQISEGLELARRYNCEVPSCELVNRIWEVADLKVSPIPMSPNKGRDAEQYEAHADKLEAQVAGKEFRLLAGTHKDVVLKDGVLGLYGWHRPDGSKIQPFYSGHAPSFVDYSQGLRLVRKI